jgi:hypothetical protein
MILIGSRALALRAPYLLTKKPVDFDFVCSEEEFTQWLNNNEKKVAPNKIYSIHNKQIVEGLVNCEFEIVGQQPSTQMLVDLVNNDPETMETSFGKVLSLDLLFTLKCSHRYLKNSPYFWKTLLDYHRMKFAGAKVKEAFQDFLKVRERETYNYSHPKLNVSKDNFFKDDHIDYKFDHDTLHQAVALYGQPAYLSYMKDGEEVKSDKKKFFQCSREIQLAGVIEEACVLAAERSLIPHPGVWSPEYAWRFALSKVCTSITSGWFREFAYENALDILKMYPVYFWDKIQHGITTGLVKPFITKG